MGKKARFSAAFATAAVGMVLGGCSVAPTSEHYVYEPDSGRTHLATEWEATDHDEARRSAADRNFTQRLRTNTQSRKPVIRIGEGKVTRSSRGG